MDVAHVYRKSIPFLLDVLFFMEIVMKNKVPGADMINVSVIRINSALSGKAQILFWRQMGEVFQLLSKLVSKNVTLAQFELVYVHVYQE